MVYFTECTMDNETVCASDVLIEARMLCMSIYQWELGWLPHLPDTRLACMLKAI